MNIDEFDQKSKGIPLVSCLEIPVKWVLPAYSCKMCCFEETSDMNSVREIVENIVHFH